MRCSSYRLERRWEHDGSRPGRSGHGRLRPENGPAIPRRDGGARRRGADRRRQPVRARSTMRPIRTGRGCGSARGSRARSGSRRTIRRSPSAAAKGRRSRPEYQAKFEANLADQAKGGQGTSATFTCLPNGMPRMMSAYEPLEIVITPDITYVLIDHIEHSRHIYTDGRPWPAEIEPSWVGYSIGKWIDTDGDGRFDTLEIESRGFKGPRAYDASGLPLARGQRERLQGAHLPRQAGPRSPARRDHHHRPCADPAVDGDQELPPQSLSEGGMARVDLRREQSARRDRQGQLLPQRRRPPDAGAQGPGAAGPAVFQIAGGKP